jgi:hypothetical protein
MGIWNEDNVGRNLGQCSAMNSPLPAKKKTAQLIEICIWVKDNPNTIWKMTNYLKLYWTRVFRPWFLLRLGWNNEIAYFLCRTSFFLVHASLISSAKRQRIIGQFNFLTDAREFTSRIIYRNFTSAKFWFKNERLTPAVSVTNCCCMMVSLVSTVWSLYALRLMISWQLRYQ